MKRIAWVLVVALGIIMAIVKTHTAVDSGGGPRMSVTSSDANFIVSSEADTGPGSLRDAILAADRLPGHSRIAIRVAQVLIESALPTLINPQGIVIEGRDGGTIIEAAHQRDGSTLQVKSPRSALRRLTLVHARNRAVTVMAPGVEIDSLDISDCGTGIVIAAGSEGLTIRHSRFERNATAIMSDAFLHDVTIVDSSFSESARAGIWFVGADPSLSNELGSSAIINVANDTFSKNDIGIVLGNRPALIQKSRFADNKSAGILVLGGSATLSGNDVRHSLGNGISVTNGNTVRIDHNSIEDILGVAILLRDTSATIEDNNLERNAYGIVAVDAKNAGATVIRGNVLKKTVVDAITIIGGAPLLDHNQALESRSAGLRVLDLVQSGAQIKANPHLLANTLKGNAVDLPLTGVYRTSGTGQP